LGEGSSPVDGGNEMKKALEPLTKSEKKRARELRIEIDFLERIAKGRYNVYKLMGDKYWFASYLLAIAEYGKIYKASIDAGHDVWGFNE
jgi:hypothetical protein